MDNADLRALILGAMKAAYEAGHHATVEGQYHEEWPDDHVDDWMDDEGITDPGYVRVPVEPTAEMIRKGQGQWSGESMVEIYKAMLAAATQEKAMTDMTAEQALVKELREMCNGHPHAAIPWPHRILHRAADAIEALTAPRVPELTVRVLSFPESNGKRNWTAMIVRKQAWGGLVGNCGGITVARGELWNRVAYEAECARLLLGERDTQPDILDYGDDIETPDEWAGEVRGGYPIKDRPMLTAAPEPAEDGQQAGIDDIWIASGKEYDRSIHTNPDHYAWAELFISTFPNLGADKDTMAGWFANAMMAKVDSMTFHADSELARLRERVKELEAFRSAVIGWRESDWREGFCRHTAESIAQHGERYEEAAEREGGSDE